MNDERTMAGRPSRLKSDGPASGCRIVVQFAWVIIRIPAGLLGGHSSSAGSGPKAAAIVPPGFFGSSKPSGRTMRGRIPSPEPWPPDPRLALTPAARREAVSAASAWSWSRPPAWVAVGGLRRGDPFAQYDPAAAQPHQHQAEGHNHQRREEGRQQPDAFMWLARGRHRRGKRGDSQRLPPDHERTSDRHDRPRRPEPSPAPRG